MNLSNEVAKPYHGKKVNTSAPSAMPNLKDRIKSCMQSVHDFGEWYVELSESHSSCLSAPMSNIGPVCRFQEELADTAAAALTEVLVPEWRKESDSLLFDKTELKSEAPAGAQTNRPFAPCEGMSDLVRAAEEFFVLPYLGFIQNMIARIRSTAIGMLALFLGLTLAVASYPFEPRQPLGFVFVGLFLISGITVAYVYAGMLRNATLSYVTDTNPGELGWQFWLRLLTFGIGPLIALLTTLFPSLTDFLVSWFQPGSQALK